MQSMKTHLKALPMMALVSLVATQAFGQAPGPMEFPGGFPTPETAQRLYDEADLNRAIQGNCSGGHCC
jgi:hypothetical protein